MNVTITDYANIPDIDFLLDTEQCQSDDVAIKGQDCYTATPQFTVHYKYKDASGTAWDTTLTQVLTMKFDTISWPFAYDATSLTVSSDCH